MIKSNLFALRILSKSYYDALMQAYYIETISQVELEKIQKIKLEKLIEHAKNNVLYYKNIFNENSIYDINDFSKIPFLNKQIIKQNKDLLRASNMPHKRFKHNSTSGSTGEAMKFYSDKNTDVHRHAVSHRGDSWTGWKFGEPIIIIWGASSDTKKAKALKSKILNSSFLFNTTILSSFQMTETDIVEYIKKICQIKPKLIVGYPSSLEVISEYIIANKIQIHIPKGIITGGETLHQYQREKIELAFSAKLLNRYGSRDVGHIANECEFQNGLHISSDHVLVEIVNEKGEICKPGELGEIVVTDLDNYVFPFIRYKIGDIGIMSEKKCQCKRPFPMLESVEGRTFDIIIGTNGNRVPGNYFTLLRYDLPNIEQFQIVQKVFGSLELKVKVTNDFSSNDFDKIRTLFRQKLGKEMEINITVVDEIQPTIAGKFRWVISDIN